jgi:CRP-like cAMP-binding protein
MDATAVERLAGAGAEVELPAGQVIIEPGQQGLGLFVIRSGTVQIDAHWGVRELGPGAVFGGRALRNPHGERTARVHAKTDVVLVAVDRATVERLCAEDPTVAGCYELD